MRERKPKGDRPDARKGPPARPRSKAAEAPRDPKVSAPVELPASGQTAKPAAAVGPSPAGAARDAVGISKPAPAVKSPVKADSVAKSAPAPAPKGPVAQPMPTPRPVAAEPARDLERAVRTATAAAAEAAKPTAAIETMSAVARAGAPAAARTVGAGAEDLRRTFAGLPGTGEAMGRAMTDTASSAARGWLDLNGKMLDVLRVQGDAAFALWRDTVTARSFPEAVRAQTDGLRRLYETSAVQWREVAEAAARLMGDAAKPMGAARPNRSS